MKSWFFCFCFRLIDEMSLDALTYAYSYISLSYHIISDSPFLHHLQSWSNFILSMSDQTVPYGLGSEIWFFDFRTRLLKKRRNEKLEKPDPRTQSVGNGFMLCICRQLEVIRINNDSKHRSIKSPPYFFREKQTLCPFVYLLHVINFTHFQTMQVSIWD